MTWTPPAPPKTGGDLFLHYDTATGDSNWEASAGGVTDHTALTNLGWTVSGHFGSAADKMPYFTTAGAAAETTLTSLARNLLDDTTTGGMQSTLGLVIDTNVQAWDAHLDDLAALPTATIANQMMVSTGAGVWALESGSTLRGSIGVSIGTDVQAHSASLDDLLNVGTVPGNSYFLVGQSAGVWVYETGSTARTSLGLGTANSVTFSSLTLTSSLTMGSGDDIHLGGSSAWIEGNNSDITYTAGASDDHIFRQGTTPYATFDGGQQSLIMSGAGGVQLPSSAPLWWGSTFTTIKGTSSDITLDASGSVFIETAVVQMDTDAQLRFGGTSTYITGSNTNNLLLRAANDLSFAPVDDSFWSQSGGSSTMRYDGANRRLGINNTAPSYPLDIQAFAATSYVARIRSHATNSTDILNLQMMGDSTPDAGETFIAFLGSTGSIRGSIAGDGVGVDYNETSDRRLKFNIQTAPDMLGVVNSMHFVQHEWKERPGRVKYGVIAQELHEVYPLAVTDTTKRNAIRRLVWYRQKKNGLDEAGKRRVEAHDRVLLTVDAIKTLREDPKITITKVRELTEEDPEYAWWQVNYSKLVVPIGKALQELAYKHEALEAKVESQDLVIADLLTRLEALEAT